MNSYDRIYNLLLEYRELYHKKDSDLTPQRDALHNLKDKKPTTLKDKFKVKYGAAKEFVSNARDIRRRISAAPKRGEIHFAKEGGVDSKLEKFAKVYSKLTRRPFSADTLEHPDYDPEIEGSKANRMAARLYGAETARKGAEYAFHPTKKDSEKAFAQSDHGAKEPSKYERVQRMLNRMRRKGHHKRIQQHKKAGRTVVGTLGAGHFEDNA